MLQYSLNPTALNVELASQESAGDMWDIDVMRLPRFPRDSDEKQLMVFAVRDCDSGKVIFAKAIRKAEFTSGLVSETLKGLTEEYGWPKHICIDWSVPQAGLRDLLAKETRILELRYVTIGLMPGSVELFFKTLLRKSHEMPFISGESSAEERNSWLNDMMVMFNAREKR